MKLNMFSTMRNNLAVNDERIAQERTRMSLQMLRFIQCVLVVTQLIGIALSVLFPDNERFAVSPFVYMLIILPFIIEPMFACVRGSIGAQKHDSAFFIVGMIESGYFVFEAVGLICGYWSVAMLLSFPLGMVVYYLVCTVLYSMIGVKRVSQSDDDDK